jgi:prepilin-type N-terminal cleavage/methylation domain-containing protein
MLIVKKCSSIKIGCNGFTLIEILIAFVLLGIAVAVSAQLFSTNMQNIVRSKNYLPAVVLADATMREMIGKDFLEDTTITNVTNSDYRADVRTAEIMKDRFQHLPVKLMEVDLIVRWQIDRKEKSCILKSYKTVKRHLNSEDNKKEEAFMQKK